MTEIKNNIPESEFQNFELDEVIYKTLLTKKYKERKKYKPIDPMKLMSFIPGTIDSILVEEGQKIVVGTPIMVVEAMKMKNEIMSDKEATVKKIHVLEGERVPKNVLMIEFE